MMSGPSHSWSCGDQKLTGVSSSLWQLDVALKCHHAQTYAAGPKIELPAAAMQAILTAEHIAKLDRQLGAPQAPACDTTSNVSSSSHVSEILFPSPFTSPLPAIAQQPVDRAGPAHVLVQPLRAARSHRSPAKSAVEGSRRAGGARKPAAGAAQGLGSGSGLDALAACAAMLCGDVGLPQPPQRSAARRGHRTSQVCILCSITFS